jgi:DNA-binding HxlR family transcriptional regulator
VRSSITVGTTLDQMAHPRNRFPTGDPEIVDLDEPLGQFCAVAAALDVLGDAQAVLHLRDLLWHGPQTVAQLAERNLPADHAAVTARLERMQALGLVELAPVDGDATYRATMLGRSAEPVVRALHDFGIDVIRRRPLTPAMMCHIVAVGAIDHHDELVRVDLSAVVGLEVSGRRMGVVIAPGILRTDAHVSADVDAACTQDVFVDLLSGMVTVEDAVRRGELAVRGSVVPVAVLFDLLRQPGPR